MLDKVPAPLRHALIVSAGILLSYATSQVTSLPAPLPELAGVVLAMAAMYLTKLTKQYGIGSNDFVDEEDLEDAADQK